MEHQYSIALMGYSHGHRKKSKPRARERSDVEQKVVSGSCHP